MRVYKAREAGLIALFILSTVLVCAVGLFSSVTSSSLEQTVSRRLSTRSYTSENISSLQALEVLWAANGYTDDYGSIPKIGNDRSLMTFLVNATGSYQYIPENNSLVTHDQTVNKETIRPHNQDWPSDASAVLVIVWNSTNMNNGYFASAETGCLVQNVYLAAASLNLGTCCVGDVNSEGLRNDLQLPSHLIPLLVMPLGYSTIPYPPASPNYDIMIGNLPPVQYSELSFEEAIRNMTITHNWSTKNLSLQELSQLLWSAYGYTNVTRNGTYHKTTPSAWGIYPLVIFVSNASGVYQYLPENHSISKLLYDDKRLDMANACSGQAWAADAPTIFLVVYDSAYNGGDTGDGGTLPHGFMEVNAGAVIQQLLLEASAWNLSSNVVSDGFEEWNGTAAEELRSILNLPSSLIPLYLIPIGHKTGVHLHDVAVTNVTPTKTVVGKGCFLDVNVTVQNLGDYEENCNVTLYTNSTSIETQTANNLLKGTSTTLTFTWNTTDFTKGNYTISARVTPIPGELDITDNNITNGWIIIAMVGDITGPDGWPDGECDMRDVGLVARCFGQTVPPAPANCDMTGPVAGIPDGEVDMRDVGLVARQFGQTDP